MLSQHEFNIKNKDFIPLRALLRVDPCSQIYSFSDDSRLVTEKDFWEGEEGGKGLYLEYQNINGREISISKGINEYDDAVFEEAAFRNEECDRWIESYLIKPITSNVYVIRGYAGCGKTIFVNSICHKMKRTNDQIHIIDIGSQRAGAGLNEGLIFYRALYNYFARMLYDLKPEEYEELLKFRGVLYLDLINEFNQDLFTALSRLPQKAQLNEEAIRRFLIELDNLYSVREKGVETLSYGRLDVMISLIMLVVCIKAIKSKVKVENCSIVFDNIDIITNPVIPAESLLVFWKSIDQYVNFKMEYDKSHAESMLPTINILMTLRKIVHSHVAEHIAVLEDYGTANPEHLTICDISNLYLSSCILKHRISYWESRINNKKILEKINHLKVIANVSNESNNDSEEQPYVIDLDSLMNHNLRAYSNVISHFMENEEYFKIIEKDFNENAISLEWKKVSTLVFLLTYLYREKKIWPQMGFGCVVYKDNKRIKSQTDYPTTLDRLILNYLYVCKKSRIYYGEIKNVAPEREDIPYKDFAKGISLEAIQQDLVRAGFIKCAQNTSEEQNVKLFNNCSEDKTRSLIHKKIADMCSINLGENGFQGYASEDLEMWRRPIYFAKGVRINYNGAKPSDLIECFEKAEFPDDILFEITDEGITLIEDIFASFEFYSARYCKDISVSKPLHQIEDIDQMSKVISNVYNEVEICCKRHSLFMIKYMEKYQISLDEYLKKPFHPRTRFRKENDGKPNKSSFRPQLHIVRVIFNHIAYLDNIKEQSSYDIRETLTIWIEKYLELFKKYLKKDLANSKLGIADCKIQNNMIQWTERQKKSYYINIPITSKTIQ